ncbi:hypothetical protein F2Q69_00047694 [Brassica cretica]|uniref:Uncharacterized protein n=1 Tax=Brassica cretica TaxID=69181 RepID=A0A8S9PTT5_BRACR|nr:hypothetical protein F2Q69_00047694 [Brassica cretica]
MKLRISSNINAIRLKSMTDQVHNSRTLTSQANSCLPPAEQQAGSLRQTRKEAPPRLLPNRATRELEPIDPKSFLQSTGSSTPCSRSCSCALTAWPSPTQESIRSQS